jgi:hypothetical protein
MSFAVVLQTVDRIVLASDSRAWDVERDAESAVVARKVDVDAHGYGFMMTGDPLPCDAWKLTPAVPGENARARAHRILERVDRRTTRPRRFSIAVTRFGGAAAGAIGGWTIGASSLTSTNIGLYSGAVGTARLQVGSGSTFAGMTSADSGSLVAIYAGATDNTTRASAPFRVTAAGAVTATSGTIGGWTLGATTLSAGNVTLNASTGVNIQALSTSSWDSFNTSNAVRFMDSAAAVYGGIAGAYNGFDKSIIVQAESTTTDKAGRLELVAKGLSDGGAARTASVSINAGNAAFGEFIALNAGTTGEINLISPTIASKEIWINGGAPTVSLKLTNTNGGGKSFKLIPQLVGASDAGFTIYDDTAAAARLGIDTSGATYIPGVYAATTAGGTAVHVIDANGQLARFTSSSRYKTDVADLRASQWANVLDLRPRRFKSLSRADDAQREFTGLVAEEVHALVPDLVGLDAEGRPDTVDYARLAVFLLPELRALKQANTALAARVAQLEGARS